MMTFDPDTSIVQEVNFYD
jgi:hypothetical protein